MFVKWIFVIKMLDKLDLVDLQPPSHSHQTTPLSITIKTDSFTKSYYR